MKILKKYWNKLKDEIRIIKFLFRCNVRSRYQNNSELFSFACEQGKTEIVKALLRDPKIDPAVPHNYPLWAACLNQNIEIIKLLLDHKYIDPTYYYSDQYSPMDHDLFVTSALYGNYDVAMILLKDKRMMVTKQIVNYIEATKSIFAPTRRIREYSKFDLAYDTKGSIPEITHRIVMNREEIIRLYKNMINMPQPMRIKYLEGDTDINNLSQTGFFE